MTIYPQKNVFIALYPLMERVGVTSLCSQRHAVQTYHKHAELKPKRQLPVWTMTPQVHRLQVTVCNYSN